MASNLMNDSVIEIIASGNAKEIKAFLAANSDLYGALDKSGFNLLMLGAICANKAVMGILLGRLYAQINDIDEDGYTALMYAAKYGNMGAVQSLLNYGVNTKTKNKEGNIAFMIAKKAGNKEIYELLKEHEIEAQSSKKVAGDIEKSDNYGEITESFSKSRKKETSGCFKVAAFIVVMIMLGAFFGEDTKTVQHTTTKLPASQKKSNANYLKKSTTSEDSVKPLLSEYPHFNTIRSVYKLMPFKIADGVKTGAYRTGKKLIDAIVSSDLALAKKIIEEDQSKKIVDEIDARHATPLMYASYLGQIDIVNLLLKSGASVNARDKFLNNALNYAIEEGYTGIAKLLMMKGANPGESLMFAIARGRVEIALYFIEKGADVNYSDKRKDTPLSYAAYYGRPEIVKAILEKGAKTSQTNINGCTPLLMAVQDTDGTEIVKLLLEKGAITDEIDPSMNTPLMWASFNGFNDAVALLVEKGADIHAKNNYGYNAFIYAGYNGQIDTIKFLFQKGAKIEDKNGYLDNALTWASYNGHYSVVKFLIEKGADINIVNCNRYTPMTLALEKNHYSIIKLLQDAQKNK
ncbi:MAG TPA: ankyrin repeat domain-containing protein [Candidatus Wallbacteria bacterium]|nr:ankyrin repeat domain-containing protein [Candidatus Wallbacteria bacterium]